MYSEESVHRALSMILCSTCTLGIQDISKPLSLYQPSLLRCARSKELLPHLKRVLGNGNYVYIAHGYDGRQHRISLPL